MDFSYKAEDRTKNAEHRVQNTECRTLSAEHRVQNTECRTQCRTQNAEHRVQNTECRTQRTDTVSRLKADRIYTVK